MFLLFGKQFPYVYKNLLCKEVIPIIESYIPTLVDLIGPNNIINFNYIYEIIYATNYINSSPLNIKNSKKKKYITCSIF